MLQIGSILEMMMKVSSSVVLFKAENFSNDEIFFCISEGRGAASLFIYLERREKKKKREKKYATIRV